MKILVPLIRYEPSGCATALLRNWPRSVPQCASVRFMVPVHLPAIIGGKYVAFCSGEPCAYNAEIAPCVSSGYMAKDMFAEHMNSLTISEITAGRPWPPNSTGAEMPIQPPSVSCRYASLNPRGVVTLASSCRVQPSASPMLFNGLSTSSQNFAASPRIASTTSGEASE